MANETQPVHYEDLVGVRSRIAWGAVIAGSVVAVAGYLVLTFFFAAVGLSLTEAGIRSEGAALGGAAAAALVTIVVSLFLGGWVATQLTAGETHREAIIYGVLTWAVVTGFSLMVVGMGVRAGYFALVSTTMVAQNSPAAQQSWEQSARDAGVSQERIDQVKKDVNPDKAKAVANDPANQERARETAIAVAWASLAGTLLSIAAAIAGALTGAGPTFRLFPAAARRQEIIIAR